MKLGTASVDAVFATVYLAQQDGSRLVQGQQIAETLGVPVDSLLKILQQLVRGGVLFSKRGRHGGFSLSRSPEETSLLDILEAVEGSLDFQFTPPSQASHLANVEPRLQSVCRQITEETVAILRQTTVGQLRTG